MWERRSFRTVRFTGAALCILRAEPCPGRLWMSTIFPPRGISMTGKEKTADLLTARYSWEEGYWFINTSRELQAFSSPCYTSNRSQRCTLSFPAVWKEASCTCVLWLGWCHPKTIWTCERELSSLGKSTFEQYKFDSSETICTFAISQIQDSQQAWRAVTKPSCSVTVDYKPYQKLPRSTMIMK